MDVIKQKDMKLVLKNKDRDKN